MLESLESRRLLSYTADGIVLVVAYPRGIPVGWNQIPAEGVTVWIDRNKNDKRDRGEPSAKVGSSGLTTFKRLREGTYRIGVEATDYPYSLKKPVFSDMHITKPWDPYRRRDSYYSRDSGTIVEADIRLAVTQDMPGFNGISGTVFFDKDASGTTDDRLNQPDTGLQGTRVYIDVNDNERFDKAEPSTFTASDGTYGLSRWTESLLGCRVRVGNGDMHLTTRLDKLKRSATRDFGLTKPMPTASITVGTKLASSLDIRDDTDDDLPQGTACIPGARIYLDINRDGTWSRGEPRKTVTEGPVTFSGLIPGTYRIRAIGVMALSATRKYIDLTVADREQTSRGFVFKGTRRLGFRFFTDADGDKTLDPDELALPVQRGGNDTPFDKLMFNGDSFLRLHFQHLRDKNSDVIWVNDLPAAPGLVAYYMMVTQNPDDRWFPFTDYYRIPIPADAPDGTII